MNIGIIGDGRAATAAAIRAVLIACSISEEEAKVTIICLDDNAHRFVKASEAGDRLRKAMTALSHTPYREAEPKKPVFFQRDIVPNRKRRFGTN